MAPVIPVASLKCLSTTDVCNKLVGSLSNHRSRCKRHRSGLPPDTIPCYAYDQLGDYVASMLPANVRQDMLSHLLLKPIDLHLRYLGIKILLRPGVRELKVKDILDTMQGGLMKFIRQEGRHLEVLHLDIRLDPKMEPLLLTMLPNLHVIKVLSLQSMCTNKALEVIGWNCCILEQLDIRWCNGVTDLGLRRLVKKGNSPCCQTLKILGLGTACHAKLLTPEGVADVMKVCRRIQDVTDYPHMSEVLKLLWKEGVRITDLKVFQNIDITVQGILDVHLMVPDLVTLSLDGVSTTALHELVVIQNLRTLTLKNFDCQHLLAYLEEQGQTLTSLTLEDGTGDLNLVRVMQSCPDLPTLSAQKLSIISGMNFDLHSNLTNISLSFLDTKDFKLAMLLQQCPSLQQVNVSGEVTITDLELSKSVMKNPLSDLTWFWLGNAPNLTQKSVWMMLGLPSLRNLGHMSGWGLTKDEVLEVLTYIRTFRLDLYLMQCYFLDSAHDPYL